MCMLSHIGTHRKHWRRVGAVRKPIEIIKAARERRKGKLKMRNRISLVIVSAALLLSSRVPAGQVGELRKGQIVTKGYAAYLLPPIDKEGGKSFVTVSAPRERWIVEEGPTDNNPAVFMMNGGWYCDEWLAKAKTAANERYIEVQLSALDQPIVAVMQHKYSQQGMSTEDALEKAKAPLIEPWLLKNIQADNAKCEISDRSELFRIHTEISKPAPEAAYLR